jgi:chromate reductase, NAD(P)H dehydrogenase (quinone)
MKPSVLVLAGSTRRESYNKRLARVAAAALEEAGAHVTLLDLRDLPMPLYDGDLEAAHGLPENARRLKDLFKSHPALLIASPEYNGSVTAVLKNAIDWASRAEPGEPSLAAFSGKVAAVISASPGALGGLRSTTHLRAILGAIGVLVLPDHLALSRAADAFDADGALADPARRETLAALARRLVQVTERLTT